MILYGLTIFLSSFLLFIVQPILGKYLLPWFGGSPAVWTVCMLFFQALLLAGYAYAHLLVKSRRISRQAAVHLLLLTVAIVALPGLPSAAWRPSASSYPFWRILGMLAAGAGVPYFALSAASPLLQSWYALSYPGRSPYRLYSLSNLGSLLAIGCYPVLVEPNSPLRQQAHIWSWLFAGYAGMCCLCAVRAMKGREGAGERGRLPVDGDPQAGSSGRRFFWIALPACGSLMLLATTNQLCQDVAVIPLLWLLPLALYLLSFVLCFHSARIYSRLWFGIALAAALAQACYVLYGGVFLDIRIQVASYSFTLFCCCMVCHGELVRLKPEPQRLTEFYLLIAFGGTFGGLVVSVAAPHVFGGFWEFHLGLAATAALFLGAMFTDAGSGLHHGRPFWAWTLLYAASGCLMLALVLHARDSRDDRLDGARNFFGVLRVLELDKGDPREHRLTLMHGRIEHGFQFQAAERRNWPTSYFGYGSGIGIALRYHPNRLAPDSSQQGLRIGVVGLGAGTIASYCRKEDSIRFYEINSEVVRLSAKYFSYLRDCRGSVELALGDARISMEREKEQGVSQKFDVLGIDAFTGDAIPVHLLTGECFRIFRFHMKQDGILAFHVSSRYFDLAPVIRSLASLDSRENYQAILVAGKSDQSQGADSSDWVLVTSNQVFLNSRGVQKAVQPWSNGDRPPMLWTDDYSNLVHLLR